MSFPNTSGKKLRVGILGATGAVGQRFIQLLEGHPWFEVTALGASEKNHGKVYGEVVNWKVSADVPAYVRPLKIFNVEQIDLFLPLVDLVFSGLDSSVAGHVETAFAEKGVAVFSNAKNHRMDSDVPILIPTINANQIEIVKTQDTFKATGGFIVTNANCSSTGLSIVLKPIHEKFGIKEMVATTLQAISGAGYPGISAMDITENVVPYISGEEEKIEIEPPKILGTHKAGANTIEYAPIRASAMCHRVPVIDGHTVSVTLKLDRRPADEAELVAEVKKCLAEYEVPATVAALPSCPERAIYVREEADRPQPRLDRMAGKGQAAVVGRVRPCPLFDVRLVTLSHNTIIGAAGGSLLNAELAAHLGLIKARA